MSPTFYRNMCHRHLSNTDFYSNLRQNDPSDIIYNEITRFTNKYEKLLTDNEQDYILKSKYNIANFYMLPKLHKSKELNDIITNSPQEYYKIQDIVIDGRPIVAGCSYYTYALSLLVHKIMEPALVQIKQILKDTFDFVNNSNNDEVFDIGTVLCTADIKSLYTNIDHQQGMESLSFWLDKLEAQLPLLKRFSKLFVLDAMFIVLSFNYFYIDVDYYHQKKETAMGTPAAVVYANLHVARIEFTLFIRLPEIYPADFITWFIENYRRFLDDVYHLWDEKLDIEPLYNLFNSIDPNIEFINERPCKSINFLDVKCTLSDDNKIKFDIYYKPTNSLKNNLMKREHPIDTICQSLSKAYSPKFIDTNTLENINFVHTFNPNGIFNKKLIVNCFEDVNDSTLKEIFTNVKPRLTTRQEKSLSKMLCRAKFETKSLVNTDIKPTGLDICSNSRCQLHSLKYITPCKEFTLLVNNKSFTWKYTRHFDCNSKNLIYVMKCLHCDEFYIGETQSLREHMNNAKSSIRYPNNAPVPYAQHFNTCSNLKEPYFRCYPIYYESDVMLRRFKEWRFIKRLNPSLNNKL